MNIPRTLTGRFVLVYLSFIWTVGTVVLMVVFGRENMAVVSTQSFQYGDCFIASKLLSGTQN